MVLDLSANEQKACEKDNEQHGPEESDSEEIPDMDPAPTADATAPSPPPMLKVETVDVATLTIGSTYDILDSSNRWCEGEIVKIDHSNNRVFASYLYWDSRFDEWIADIAARVAPLHAHTYTQGGRLKVGQRVEVLDEQLVWREAFVIDEDNGRVKVHYKGYHTKFDEWIDRSRSDRFIPYGRNKLVARRKQHMLWSAGAVRGSQALALSNEATSRVRRIDADPRQRRIESVSQQFLQYKRALEDQQLTITSVSGDGNCLFRSVAHQIYGSEEHHVVVRLKCMEYMEAEADFYSQFVEGGKETFPLYLAAKRRPGCWGDDPEIQAMCELYNRPAEIWAYDPTRGARKLRTFHESFNAHAHVGAVSGLVMRLSYYGGGHYDSVVNAHHRDHVLIRKPGEVEDQRIYWSKHRHDLARLSGLVAADAVSVELACQESRRLHSERECDDLETCLMLSLEGMKGFEPKSASSARDDRELDVLATQGEMLRSAREESEREALEKAILSSLESSATEETLLQLALQSSQQDGAPGGGLEAARDGDMDEGMRLALQLSTMSDQEALELALSQSLRSPRVSSELGASASTSVPADPVTEDDELRRAIAASLEVIEPQATMLECLDAHADVLPPRELEDDLDEDLMRAIQESLRR